MAESASRPFWVDAQLPPMLASHLRDEFGVDAHHVFEFEAHTASDKTIFSMARAAGGIVLTKDVDFVQLLDRFGPPPCIIWITIGNAKNAELWTIVRGHWPRILRLLEQGETLIELR
jgi:predicted nuclease of predicted toxin-antitoxin system